MIGKSFGKYRIVDELGRGRLGAVYRAIDESVGREVAIRILRPELQDSEALKRFMADATILAKLNRHEHAALYGVKKVDPDLLMLMELVRGESIEQLASRPGPLPPERSAYLMSQVLDALSHAHNAGVFHRDIKPSNLMLTDTRYIKIMDFGFGRLLETERESRRNGQMAEPYLAPEQLLFKTVDARTDLFACGVVLYRMLTDTLPFHARTPAEVMHKQLHESPTPASACLPGLPAWCDRVLTKALAKDPADRFQTAEEFRTVLMPAPNSSSEVRTDSFAAMTIVVAPSAKSGSAPVAPAVSSPTSTPSAKAVTPSATPAAPAPAALPSAPATPDVAPLQRTKLVTAALVLVAIVVAVIAYNFGAVLMQPEAPRANDAQQSPASAAPAPTTPVPAPEAAPSPGANAAATPDSQVAPPAAASPAAAVASTPTAGTPPRSTATAPAVTAEKTTAAPAFPYMVFDAQAVVADRDKFRERDASVVLADGKISVVEKSNRVIALMPFDALAGISYSTARHPQWTSPNGPADLLEVEGGVFGIRRSGRNWIALRTRDAVQVIRIKDEDISRVIAALEARAGRPVDRVAEQKE